VSTTSGSLPTGEFRFISANHTADGDIATLELHFASTSSLDLTLRYFCRREDAAIEQRCVVHNSGTMPIGLQHFNPMLLSLKRLDGGRGAV
jgi:hypothetical protein